MGGRKAGFIPAVTQSCSSKRLQTLWLTGGGSVGEDEVLTRALGGRKAGFIPAVTQSCSSKRLQALWLIGGGPVGEDEVLTRALLPAWR
jgi:hypothetical protein